MGPKIDPKIYAKMKPKKGRILDPISKSADPPLGSDFCITPWQPPLRGGRYTTVHCVPVPSTALPVIRRPCRRVRGVVHVSWCYILLPLVPSGI
jgi:hypothetical protein